MDKPGKLTTEATACNFAALQTMRRCVCRIYQRFTLIIHDHSVAQTAPFQFPGGSQYQGGLAGAEKAAHHNNPGFDHGYSFDHSVSPIFRQAAKDAYSTTCRLVSAVASELPPTHIW